MIFILLLSLFYTCLTVVSSQLLLSLSVPILLLLTYLLPPIVNSICLGLQKDNSWKAWSAGIFPTMSMIFYATFAYITSSNGQWAQFSQLNTVSDDVMSVEVASNLLAPSQILFVAVVYYGVAIATYFIQQTSRQKEKGVTYA
ncbi:MULTISPECIES: Msa family membrane protein [Streptococcus]|nr:MULTISPECIES: Msa family membrane protein [Streptococcus]MBL6440780.1 Msa family membrane protein [Streptococcus suis]MBM7136674.1 Msa family membrane protein [Streptococcus suis]MBY0731645.1 Msa family membrane protein [Streptococcus sp. 2018162]MCO8177752.1 Msa family membrane protein [Streptococcus suis]QZS61933.1 Msa family membrane protein [Streptococcus suis]